MNARRSAGSLRRLSAAATTALRPGRARPRSLSTSVASGGSSSSEREPWEPRCPRVFLRGLGYKDNVAEGVLKELTTNWGVAAGSELPMVKALAGAWEIGADAGLDALAKVRVRVRFRVRVPALASDAPGGRQLLKDATNYLRTPPAPQTLTLTLTLTLTFTKAVERELARSEGKAMVKFVVQAGVTVVDCQGFEGMSLKDVIDHGEDRGSQTLGQLLECACSGVSVRVRVGVRVRASSSSARVAA